ncbi:MAG: 5'/3'-nucleotidase SurE [Thermodesulfobacteriota bacterium]
MTDGNYFILLTNDDGIHAEGLRLLRRAMRDIGTVAIVAPDVERSAVGHAITLYDPIKVNEVTRNGEFYGHAVAGTPADAVKLAVNSLLPRRPDLVIAGINNGANLGFNVLYSGTVSAATEAAILGVPAMAVSLAQKKDPPFEFALPHVALLARWILREGLPRGVALNVNIPAIPPDEICGYRLTRQCLAPYWDSYEQREDPRGNIYYWLSGEVPPEEKDETVDITALKRGYVSITPLFYDLTAHNCRPALDRLLEKL